ncbi:hypothetical protein ACFQMM_11550 [Saliphagus sp. GCM10025308]
MILNVRVDNVTRLLRETNDAFTIGSIFQWGLFARAVGELEALLLSVVVLEIEAAKCAQTCAGIPRQREQRMRA